MMGRSSRAEADEMRRDETRAGQSESELKPRKVELRHV
jgi:hypothetical protein